MSEITGDMISTAKRMLAQKEILPLKIRGHEFYIFPVNGDCRVLELGIARKNCTTTTALSVCFAAFVVGIRNSAFASRRWFMTEYSSTICVESIKTVGTV